MQESRFSAWRTNVLVLTMAGLLFLDSANQALAHGGGGIAPPPLNNGHAAVAVHPLGTVHESSVTRSKTYGAATKVPLVAPQVGANTTELGQTGQALSLDLTSSADNIILGSNLFHAAPSVTISVGGVKETFQAGSPATAAEYVAIQQVLGGGTQGVILSSAGAATGGTFSLNAAVKGNVVSLVVPTSVTAIDNTAKNSIITLTGDLTNYGSIDAISSNSKVTSGTISAADITNEAGASITSILTGSHGGVGSLSLTLDALNNIANAGSITSSGALTLTAGGNIVNALPAGAIVSASVPLIHAMNDVNLSSTSGTITNGGVVSSANGNINISTPSAATDININAVGGTFQALAGNINVRDASYTGSNNLYLTGGNYLSNNLNLYSGSGDIEAIVGQISGNLNSTAGSEHIVASTPNLQLGTNSVSGDPIFGNSTGMITITGPNTFPEDVAIVASTNIVGSGNSAEIITNGFNVLMIAGANITTMSGSSLNTIPPLTSGITFLNINGPSVSGGYIDLSSNTTGTVIDTHSNSGNGGNVTLMAFANGSNTGYVRLNNVVGTNTINTSGYPGTTDTAGGNGGNVTIIAGGPDASGNAVSGGAGVATGAIFTAGGSGSTTANSVSGSVSITTAQPAPNSTITPGIATIFVPGDIAAGSTITASTNLPANAGVMVGNIITAGGGGSFGDTSGPGPGFFGGNAGNVTIQATGNITTGAIEAYGGGGGAAAYIFGTSGAGGNGGAGGAVSITSSNGGGASVLINGDINTSGGGGGGSIGIANAATSCALGGLGGNAGSILVSAPVAANYPQSNVDSLFIAGPVMAAGGGNGGGGYYNGGSGGGSLGGGGGGVSTGSGDSAAGGGGFWGGASGDMNGDGGGGGGAFGRGFTAITSGGGLGAQGQGGTQGTSQGGVFGEAGQANDVSTYTGLANAVGANALYGYAHGANGTVSLNGGTITLGGIVSDFPQVGFSSSPFSSSSIIGGHLNMTAGDWNALFNTLSGSYGTITEVGSNSISGPTYVNFFGISGGTLASTGSGVFSLGNLTFSGENVAIIAAGGISAGTIDLTGPSGGGSLTLIADANFSPAQNPDVVAPRLDFYTTFGDFSASGNSGAISVGSVSTFSTTGGTAGSVVAVAYNGSVTFGSIDSHSTAGAAGSVQIISPGAITVGDVNTSGPSPGTISISSAIPVVITGTNTVSGVLNGGFSPAAVQNGAIQAGNLISGGGSAPLSGTGGAVSIVTDGTVSLASANTSGAGGTTVLEVPASNGAVGGNITISAGQIVTISGDLAAFGGGGGGGFGGYGTLGNAIGAPGGNGGNGGNISIITSSGSITVGGGINSSGGGGGGGGGSAGVASATGGSGGAGGAAGQIAITAPSAVAVSGAVYAVDGSAGGAGGNQGAVTDQNGAGGGGGGASYGGGGGGGGGGAGGGGNGSPFSTLLSGAAGGGGAGAFGGGGGYGVSVGGNGGGFELAPAGTPGSNGGAGFGGNGISAVPPLAAGIGGVSIGLPGTGGSALADAAAGGIGATISTSGFTGLVNITSGVALGSTPSSVSTGNAVIGDIITITAQSGNGSISFLGPMTAFGGIYLNADGSGSIVSSNSSPLSTFDLYLNVATGSAGSLSQPIVFTNSARQASLFANGSSATSGSAFITTALETLNVDQQGSSAKIGVFNLLATNANALVNTYALGSSNITIDASGTDGIIRPFSGTLQAQPDSSNNGGTLLLTASAFIGSIVTSPVILQANSVSGTGGSVTVNITAAGTTTLGTGAGQLTLNATGTSGGSVSITTPGTLSLVTNGSSPLGINVEPSSGAGGNITLTANTITWGPTTGTGNGPNLLLDASSSGGGIGGITGSVTITQTGSTPMLLGSGPSQIFLQALGTNGGSFSVTTAGSLGIVTDGSGTAQGFNLVPSSGNGGNITLNAGTITWGTTGTDNLTPLVLNSSGGTGGAAGSITISQTGNTPIILGTGNGQIKLEDTGTDAGSVSVTTAGSLGIVAISDAAPGIVVVPTTGNGGSIYLTANTVTWGSNGILKDTKLTLDANGAPTGFGGFIEVNQTSNSALNVGIGTNSLNFSATGGNNVLLLPNGSGVAVSSGGNLLVGASGITITPTNGSGENVSLQSNSATAFNYGLNSATNTNGVLGSISLVGTGGDGNLSLINLGGALTNSAAISGVSALTMTAGGSGGLTVGQNIGATSTISLSTLGTGNITSSKTITTNTLDLFSQGGSIGGTSALKFAANTVNVGAPGGAINLSDTTANTGVSPAVLNVGAFPGQITVTGTALVPAQTAINAGGAVTLTTATSIDTTASINAATTNSKVSTNITLSSTGTLAGTGIQLGGSVNASNTLATGGAVSITAASSGGIIQTVSDDISGVKSVTLTAAKGNISIGSIGQVTEPGVVSNTAVDVNTAGIKALNTITEKATGTTIGLGIINLRGGEIDATSASAGVVTLTAGIGGITASAGTDISGGKSVTLTASTGPIEIASTGSSPTGAVKLTAFSQITSSGKLAGATVTLSQTSASGLGITVNNMATTNGAISVIAAGHSVSVDGGAILSTAATTNKVSTITLQDTNTTTGNINIGASAQISTSAVSGGNGNVIIAIGPVPTAPTPNTPTGPGISYNPAQQALAPLAYNIGSTGVSLLSSTAAPISFSYVGSGQIIVNNATKGSGVITITGGSGASSPTIITADPPVGSIAGTTNTQTNAQAANVPAVTYESNTGSNSIPLVLSAASGSTQSYNLASANLSLNSVLLSSAFPNSSSASTVNASTTNVSNAVSRMLYGAATKYGVPEDSMFIAGDSNQAGNIEAALVTDPDVAGIKLTNGNIVVASDHDTVVATPFGNVKVAAQSMVVILALPTGTTVLDLDDTRSSAVVISIGNSQITLAPGRCTMITSCSAASFEMINPVESFGYRNVSSKKVDGDLRSFTAEFLMPNAIRNIKPVLALLKSSRPEAKRRTDHLLKTLAIVSQISRQGGEYRQYQHPRLTATALVK